MNWVTFKCLVVAWVAVIPCWGWAQDDDLSLKSLLDLTAFAPTKTVTKVYKSPSIVRVFDKNWLNRHNVSSLKDLLVMLPGVQIERSDKSDLAWFRGIQTRYNSKILLLIDGIPIRNYYYGHFDLAMSLKNIERVEVINGPGSVLYGANAFSAVISMTTKSSAPTSVGLSHQRGKGYQYDGTSSSLSEDVSTNHIWAEGSMANTYAQGHFFDGDIFIQELGEDGSKYNHDTAQGGKRIYIKSKIDDLTIMANYDQFTRQKYSNGAYENKEYSLGPSYLAMSYDHDFSETLAFTVKPYFHRYRFFTDSVDFLDEYENADGDDVALDFRSKVIKEKGESDYSTDTYGFDSYVTINEFPDHSIVLGISHMTNKPSPGGGRTRDTKETEFQDGAFVFGDFMDWEDKISGDSKQTTTSIYVQDVWNISSNQSLTVGLRNDNLSSFDNQTTARGGYSYLFTDNVYSKLLVGTAYRSPTFRENLKIGSESPDLGPEKIQTFEAQVGYIWDAGDLNLTLYSNKYTDFIDEISVIKAQDKIFWKDSDQEEFDAEQIYLNFEERKIFGAELYGRFHPIQSLSVEVGASRIFSAKERIGRSLRSSDEIDGLDDDPSLINGQTDPYITSRKYGTSESDLSFLSRSTQSLALGYMPSSEMTTTFSVVRQDDRRPPSPNYHDNDDIRENVGEDLTALEKNLDGYLLVNLGQSYRPMPALELRLSANNLLDKRIYSPDISEPTNYDLEWERRNYRLDVSYTF